MGVVAALCFGSWAGAAWMLRAWLRLGRLTG
jgi:hypothetical protein